MTLFTDIIPVVNGDVDLSARVAPRAEPLHYEVVATGFSDTRALGTKIKMMPLDTGVWSVTARGPLHVVVRFLMAHRRDTPAGAVYAVSWTSAPENLRRINEIMFTSLAPGVLGAPHEFLRVGHTHLLLKQITPE